MMTGTQYKDSLKDGRATFFEGLTADAYGGWKLVTNIQAGGGLFAQRIVTRRHYDMDAAKRKALALAGIEQGSAE
jgi:hypothetical protein